MPADPSTDVTQLLLEWRAGDAVAFEKLLPIVYHELHAIAARQLHKERAGHTLQATALVHEAYLKLTGKKRATVETRAQFFAVASQAVRRILVDYARKDRAGKRVGAKDKVPLEDAPTLAADFDLDLLALDVALDRLADIQPRQARIVELRFFGGLSVEETAGALDVSEATIAREWRVARLWLRRQLTAVPADEP